MANLVRLSVILLCCLFEAICVETDDSKFRDAAQFVLDTFNRRPDSSYVYDSAKIINVYEKNDSLPSLYFMQLDIAVSCSSSVDCTASHIICDVVLRENSSANAKDIVEDRTKCAAKEVESLLPTNGHGFGEESITDEIRGIAAYAVQQLENNGNAKRSVVDIMSVKRQLVGNSTTLYLTLKVARTEGGDALLFEVCEAEVNQTAEMALESNLTCFPLSGNRSDAPLSAADVTAIAERAADELDSLSYSEFTLKLVDVLRAETTVTPGSEGTVTTLELRLAPTLCLKNVDVEGDSDGLYEKRLCPENTLNGRIICSITSWDRPWVDDTLYSEPACYQDARDSGTLDTRRTNENVTDHQEGNPYTMMNDDTEPLSEESSLLAVEHHSDHSVPVVEELDPIVEKIEDSRTPVVEDTIVATHTYCTGCPTDLDVNNPALQEYVDQALAVIDEGSYGRYMHKAMRVAKAQKQVVNGVKYILHLEVAETSCLKGSTPDRASCLPDLNSVRTCLVEFLEKPWLDSSREIVNNNCTYYNNDLENEIKPQFLPNNEANRQDIFDYLDAMIEPEPVTMKVPSSYGRDGLYLPENEPENSPVETDAEQIDVGNLDEVEKKPDKLLDDQSSGSTSDEDQVSKPKKENGDSIETEQPESQTVQDHFDESDQSFEERQEKISEKIASYFTEENRDRREITPWSTPGGLKDIDSSEIELVNKLAHIAVQTLDEIDEDDKKRVVLEVLGAQKQIVNGVMYHLQLRVVSTSCSENGDDKPDCMKHYTSPVKICKVELHRSFTDNSHLDAKVVKSECAAEESVLLEKKQRQERSVGTVLVGGISPANTSDPYITRLADFAVSELDRGTNSLYTQCIVKIVNASTQVVAGYNVYLVLELGESNVRKGETNNGICELNQNSEIKTCHVTIWDRPWLGNAQEVTSFNCLPSESRVTEELSAHQVKRHTNLLTGAPIQADISDPYIQEIANTALVEVDGRSNALYRQKVVRIVEAQKQVVAGTLVRLTLELGYTTCRKGEDSDISNCQLKEDSNNQICYVEVWDRPWLQLREVTNVTCSSASAPTANPSETRSKRELPTSRVKRSVPGGINQADVNDPYIQGVASSALTEIDGRSNAHYKQKILRIVEAQQQVVAGTKVILTLELGYTTCPKGEASDISNCQLKEDLGTQTCYVEVWDRPWLQLREVTNVTCSSASAPTANPSETRSKRDLSTNRVKKRSDALTGAPAQADVNDPYIQEIASAALAEVDRRSNALYRQKVVRIVEARKQVVSGALVRLTLELGYSTCRKGHNEDIDTCQLRSNSNNQICHVEVWDRPWLKLREVTKMSCNSATENRVKRKTWIGGGTHDIHLGLFNNFINKYNKHYKNQAEYKRRFHIYRANMKKVELLQETEQGTAVYGATQFADLTSKEFKKYHLGLNPKLKDSNSIPLKEAKIPDVQLPAEFDWRSRNVVTEVKNQGSCGSCWAFSVTGNVEGQWAINKGKLFSLSEQELVDCDTMDDGCNGGLPENAYKAIESLGGLETEKDYPYEGEDEKCHFKKSDVKVTIQGAVNITKNETQMAQWLYKNGPISIGINANAMQFYMGGVSHPWKFLCNGENLDHGVLIVGYGVHTYPLFQKELPFWIIKNSWGVNWGEQGYYRVYRGDGTCGVNQMATSAIVG